MEKRMAVGVIVIVDVESLGRVAVLQRRGEFNLNHNKVVPQSYPGACQVTAHGGLEQEDSHIFLIGLEREFREELGEVAAGYLRSAIYTGKITELIRMETPEKIVVTYGAIFPEAFIYSIRLEGESGGVTFVKEEDVKNILSLKNFDKKTGVRDRSVNAMFPDEIDALRMAFEKCRDIIIPRIDDECVRGTCTHGHAGDP